MTDKPKRGRPKGYRHSAETRAKISAGLARAYENPELRERLGSVMSDAAKKGWETRRRNAADAEAGGTSTAPAPPLGDQAEHEHEQ